MPTFVFNDYYYLPTSIGTMKIPYFICDENAPDNIKNVDNPFVDNIIFQNLPETLEFSVGLWLNMDLDAEYYQHNAGSFTVTNKSNKVLFFNADITISDISGGISYVLGYDVTYNTNTITSNKARGSFNFASRNQPNATILYFIVQYNDLLCMFSRTLGYVIEISPQITVVYPHSGVLGIILIPGSFSLPNTRYYAFKVITGPNGTEDIFNNGSHNAPPDGDNNPYGPGGETTPDVESPGGEWKLPEYIPPDTPSPINDLNLGLFRAYAMTDSQLTQFSRQLWSANILTQLRNLVVSPLDVVIQLLSLPFEPDASSSATTITFNWLDGWLPGESAATGYRLSSEYKEISYIGRSDINRYSGLFYDYLPYTRCHLFIPYVGFVEVKANEFIKAHTLTIKYNVNQLTGEFTAFVKTSAMPYQLGQYQGQMGRPLPLSMQNYIPLVSSTITAAAYGTAAIMGGIAAGGGELSNIFGNPENNIPSSILEAKADESFANASTAINSVVNANAPIVRNGSFGPVTGRTSTQVPFLVFSIPHQNISSQQKLMGYSSNLSGPLSNYNGRTQVRSIRLAVPNATIQELNELKSILEGGFDI